MSGPSARGWQRMARGALVVCALAAVTSCERRPSRAEAAPTTSSAGAVRDDARARENERIRAHNEIVALVEQGALDRAEALLTEHASLLADFAPTESTRLGILLRRARAAIDGGDLIAADRAVSRALMLAPDDASVKTSAASVLVARARAADARSDKRAFLDRAIEIDPTSAAALVDRARIAEDENDLERARELLDRAKQTGALIAGIEDKLATLAKQSEVEGEFSDVRSTNFVVRFHGYANETVAWSAVRGLERAYVRVNERLSLRPPDEITVVLYSGDAYRDAVGAPDWSGGIYDGKIRIKEGDVARESGRLDDILFHEYTHALLARATKAPLPAWLHEGIAQVMEPSFAVAKHKELVVRAKQSDALLPLETMSTTFTVLPAERARVAYAIAALVTERMVARQGHSGVARVLSLCDGGLALDEAFLRVFGVELTRFYDDALDAP